MDAPSCVAAPSVPGSPCRSQRELRHRLHRRWPLKRQEQLEQQQQEQQQAQQNWRSKAMPPRLVPPLAALSRPSSPSPCRCRHSPRPRRGQRRLRGSRRPCAPFDVERGRRWRLRRKENKGGEGKTVEWFRLDRTLHFSIKPRLLFFKKPLSTQRSNGAPRRPRGCHRQAAVQVPREWSE